MKLLYCIFYLPCFAWLSDLLKLWRHNQQYNLRIYRIADYRSHLLFLRCKLQSVTANYEGTHRNRHNELLKAVLQYPQPIAVVHCVNHTVKISGPIDVNTTRYVTYLRDDLENSP